VAGCSGYGSSVHKQVYIYGGLDSSPTELIRSFGFAWSVGGWLLTPFVQKTGPTRVAELHARVVSEIKTKSISLSELLRPDILESMARKATGEKFLVTPGS
jgi:NADPH:quinone reductase